MKVQEQHRHVYQLYQIVNAARSLFLQRLMDVLRRLRLTTEMLISIVHISLRQFNGCWL
jgi:hypothetical protein